MSGSSRNVENSEGMDSKGMKIGLNGQLDGQMDKRTDGQTSAACSRTQLPDRPDPNRFALNPTRIGSHSTRPDSVRFTSFSPNWAWARAAMAAAHEPWPKAQVRLAQWAGSKPNRQMGFSPYAARFLDHKPTKPWAWIHSHPAQPTWLGRPRVETRPRSVSAPA